MLELVVVLVVIGVVAALAVPRLGASLVRQRLDAAARRIVADIDLAKRRARQTSTNVRINFNIAQSRYTFAGMPDPDHPASVYRIDLDEDPYRVELVTVDFGGATSVQFDGFGAPSSGGLVQIRAGDEQRTISIDTSTGQARVP